MKITSASDQALPVARCAAAAKSVIGSGALFASMRGAIQLLVKGRDRAGHAWHQENGIAIGLAQPAA